MSSIQCLVFPEIGNGETERVDLNEVIAHGVAKSKDKVGGVLRAFDCAAIEGRFVDELKFHGGLVRRCAKVLDVNAVDFHLLIGRGAGEEIVDRLFLGPGRQGIAGKLGVHEQQGAAEIVAHGQLVAAVIQAAKLGQEVFDLFFLRLVVKIVVFDGLSPANGVNADISCMKAVDLFDRGVSNVKRAGAQQAKAPRW